MPDSKHFMDIARHSPLIACGLILFLGVACGAGGVALYRGKPAGWADVVANDAVLRRVSIALLGTSVLLLVSGIAGALRLPGARIVCVMATLWFVIGGFWGNYAVFGGARLRHTGTNVVIAAVILWMLWIE